MSADDRENPDEPDLEPLRDQGKGATWYAYAYLTAIIVLPLLAVGVAVWAGVLDLTLSVTVDAALGQAAEWLALGLVAVFILWTFIQVVRVTGVGFMSSLIGAVARVAHNYELPNPDEDGGEE